MSRTSAIEEKWNVKLRRDYTYGFLGYEVVFPNGKTTSEWLITLDDVEKFLTENEEDLKLQGLLS